MHRDHEKSQNDSWIWRAKYRAKWSAKLRAKLRAKWGSQLKYKAYEEKPKISALLLPLKGNNEVAGILRFKFIKMKNA